VHAASGRAGRAPPGAGRAQARAGGRAGAVPGVEIFHAGTRALPDGRIVADGGRVLNVTALGRDVREAQARAYEAVHLIDWPGGFCRRDIGWRAVAREVQG
jgi:phosphoribosylamine--glycine ligase